MWAWAVVAWAGEQEPALAVRYLKDATTLLVVAPKGEHVAPEAPFDLRVGYDGYETVIGVPGELAARGVRLPDLRGRSVDGTLSLSLCTDVGDQCRQSTVAFFGAIPSGKKGEVPLAVHAPKAAPEKPAPATESSPFKVDPGPVVDRALARAARDQKLVLLDFTAVWCPPCNALSAEVLHAPDADAVLDGFLVAPVDADVPESWTLKDRYHVQGYPTVVAVSADGTERARLLGYEDRAGFIEFLARAKASVPKPEDVAPADAARIAWETALNGGDPAPWLARAPADDPLARLAKFSDNPTEADARWLIVNAPDRAGDWAIAASTVVKSKADKAAVASALERAVSTRRGIAAGDLLDALAELRPEQAKILHAAAAAAIRSSLTGDAVHDKAYWTNLAHHQELAGDLPGALATLEAAAKAWPSEMTFELSEGKMLLRANRPADAAPHLEAALKKAYGDNRLRVAASLAEAWTKLGKTLESSELAKRTLTEIPVPRDGLDVRTPKYRAELEKYVK